MIQAMQLNIFDEKNLGLSYQHFCYFDTSGEAKNIFSFSIPEASTFDRQLEWLPSWMDCLHAYPIYFCTEITDLWIEEFEDECKKYNIEFYTKGTFIGAKIYGVKINNNQEFANIFPFIDMIATMQDIVLWSTKKDCFSVVEKKFAKDDAINVTFDHDTTVFNFYMAGLNVLVLSNNQIFDNYSSIEKSLPNFVEMTITY